MSKTTVVQNIGKIIRSNEYTPESDDFDASNLPEQKSLVFLLLGGKASTDEPIIYNGHIVLKAFVVGDCSVFTELTKQLIGHATYKLIVVDSQLIVPAEIKLSNERPSAHVSLT
tara:strand:- start:18 stop:359 length:342 start_codon:yes stop_codon:yes gene_type:complete